MAPDRTMNEDMPVILFAYARPHHLSRTLEALRLNKVPLIYAFSDGPKTQEVNAGVARVREMLRQVDWCEIVLQEREANLGLGKSILAGVTEVLQKHRAVIVFEDDLVCVPGTYSYLVSALRHYENEENVMSVTGWNHPSVTPGDITESPYFDGRSECLVWGTWARAWQGMECSAASLMERCDQRGIDVYRYGADLPEMARFEIQKNIWAVRFLYLHILRGGLCLRPPWSMVEHTGFDESATNAAGADLWRNPPLRHCPTLPVKWPVPGEHPDCPSLWQSICGPRPKNRLGRKAVKNLAHQFKANASTIKKIVKLFVPPLLLDLVRKLKARLVKFSGGSVHLQTDSAYEYVPQGWDYSGTHPEVRGWSVEEIASVHEARMERFKAMAEGTGPLGLSPEADLPTSIDISQHNTVMTFAYAISLASHGLRTLSFLDWGGGLGAYYFLAKTILPGLTVEYHCKELPAMVRRARRLVPEQHFYDDESCLTRRYDFVLASGSLQYSEDWERVLRALANATKGFVLVSRLQVVDLVPSFVFLQRAYAFGYNTEYLSWCINRHVLLTEACNSGLELVREFVIGENIEIAYAPERCSTRGFLLRSTTVRQNETNAAVKAC